MLNTPGDYVKNPHFAFVWLEIDSTQITIQDDGGKQRPRHLESFSCEFQMETLGKFEIVLFDPDEDFIEGKIAASKGKCKLWYGYTTGRKSVPYEGYILEFVPEFLLTGVRITLRGIMLPLDMIKNHSTRAWTGKAIHTIVEEIAKNNKFSSVVEPTEAILVPEDLEKTDPEHKTWQEHSNDWVFMVDQLQKQAVSTKDKSGGYMLYVDMETEPPTLHFHPPRLTEAIEKTFVWRNKMTEMIKFSPKYTGNLLAVLAMGGSTQSTAMNSTTGEHTETVQSVHTGDGVGNQTDDKADYTRLPKSFAPGQTSGVLLLDHQDEAQANNEAKFWWYRNAWMASFQGTLRVVGDPKLKPFQRYDIQVAKKNGSLHWSSGIYWASGIRHEINGGTYETELLLMRTGAKSGEEPAPKPD